MSLLRLSALIAAATAASGLAQTNLYTYHGIGSVDKFGYNVTTIGDIDGDGLDDFIYSSPFMDANGRVNSGIVRVRSGATGAVIHQYDGPLAADEFGYSVDGLGDVNGDGIPDFIATRLVNATRYTGEARVYSGATGAVLHTVTGINSYDYFGISAAGVGDVNGDGYADFAVSAPGKDDNGSSSGEVTVYSGIDHAILYTWDGDAGGDQFGWWIAGAGDVNGDGFPDVLVGAPTADLPGKPDCGLIRVFSGKSGLALWTMHGDNSGDRLGWCVDGVSDVNGDGRSDVLAGAYLDDTNGTNAGMARLYSGIDGSTLFTWYGDAAGDEFGWSVRCAGDVDADGFRDVIVGARYNDQNGSNAGLARLFSGQTGAVIHTFLGHDAGDQMGYSVGSAGDVNGDGYADVILGAIYDDTIGTDAGSVTVVSFGGTSAPPRTVFLDSGCPCSNGTLPRISMEGRAQIGESYTVHIRGALPNSIAFVNLGVYWNLPLGALAPGCTAVPYPLDFVPTLIDGDGLGSATPFTMIPNDPGLIGIELFHQWFVLDPTLNTLGLATSNAINAVIGG